MIRQHLGRTIDIHGGGSDLTFPHHENEAAQSRCANQTADYVRYWLHNGMLTLGTEKMSKSLGNVRTIRDLSQQFQGETLRYALLMGKYRSQLAWSEDLIGQAQSSLNSLYQALRDKPGAMSSVDFATLEQDQFPTRFIEALCDDLNTPEALAALHEIAGKLQKAEQQADIDLYRQQLMAGGWMLGILQRDVEAYFSDTTGAELNAEQIEALIAQRNTARAERNFERADAIREELDAAGIELEDTRDGTRWRRH